MTERTDKPRKVALYARASMDDQNGDSSVEAQLVELRQWAASQGTEIHKEYSHLGPGTADAPQFQEMMNEGTTSEPPFDAVVVLDLSRLTRNFNSFHEHAERLRRNGVEIISIQ